MDSLMQRHSLSPLPVPGAPAGKAQTQGDLTEGTRKLLLFVYVTGCWL